MPEYTYKASGVTGSMVKGTAVAGSPEQLRQTLLQNKKLYLISCEEKKKKIVTKLKYNEISDFCRELSSMIGAGVSLAKAMNIIMSRDISKKLNIVFSEINSYLIRGSSLAEAMEQMGTVFPELLINMMKAGEASGTLDKVLEEMANYYEAQHKTNTNIKGAMTYPMILGIIVVLVVLLIFLFIFPKLTGVFEGMELPMITQIMVGISDTLIERWYVMIAIVGTIILLVIAFKSSYKCMYLFDKVILKLPTRKLLGSIYTARFARTLSSLYASGVSILNSLYISKNVIGNRYITAQFDEVIDCVRRGETLSSSLMKVDGFDKKLASVIVVGEETGQMDKLLLSMADSFDYEAGVAIDKMVKMIEPIMIAFMAGIILMVILSVLLPIYDLYSSVG